MGTNIEWTDATWNPVSGCTEVSPGCAHCYAKVFAERFRGVKGHYYENGFDVQLRPQQLAKPLHWKTPRRIFVNSMSDLFHEDVPFDFIDRVFAVMALTPQHTYQVLTKRPQRMREYLTQDQEEAWQRRLTWLQDSFLRGHPLPFHLRVADIAEMDPGEPWPLANVWLGVTVENQHFADERIPLLLDTPAAIRFISAEPLLQDIDLRHYLAHKRRIGINWVIVGGESGPRHRHFNPEWARHIVWQCAVSETAVFVKQLGGARPGNKIEDLPPDLKVREFPR